jgi:DNA invertase Pin-like site-specific DNA recombinase
MAVIGYARVSTDDQNLDLQLDTLRAAGAECIYQEYASGKSAKAADRPELDHCLKALRPGDTLVVWRLDRLGRSLSDIIALVAALESKAVGFKSLTECIDAAGPAGVLVLHIFGALAQFERCLIRERTKAGLAAARARGRIGGRPKAMSATDAKAAVALLNTPGVPVRDICARFGVSRSTLYAYRLATKTS